MKAHSRPPGLGPSPDWQLSSARNIEPDIYARRGEGLEAAGFAVHLVSTCYLERNTKDSLHSLFQKGGYAQYAFQICRLAHQYQMG
jgi:hypothetical protein